MGIYDDPEDITQEELDEYFLEMHIENLWEDMEIERQIEAQEQEIAEIGNTYLYVFKFTDDDYIKGMKRTLQEATDKGIVLPLNIPKVDMH